MDQKKKETLLAALIYAVAIAIIALVECISLFVFQFILGFVPQFILICGMMYLANKLVKKIHKKKE